MAKKLSAADPREVERAAREVPGVAFAEVVEDAAGPILRVVLWQDAPMEETAGLVEVALRDAMGLDIQGGDIRLAGFANASHHSPSGDMRVIDLGGNTWATEPLDPGLHPISAGEPPAHRAPSILSVTVSRGLQRCSARVELETSSGVRTAEASAPATEERMLIVVAEATAHAAGSAFEIAVPSIEETRIDRSSATPVALVVVCAPGADPQRGAGAALVGDDTFNAIARATLQAVASLIR